VRESTGTSGERKPLVSVVIPAFNEEEAIADELREITTVMDRSEYQYELIVIDDGSTDRTGEIAKASGATVIRHPVNKGSGASRRTGIHNSQGEIIVMADADGTYPCYQIPELLKWLPEYDQVVGARHTEEGTLKLLRMPTKWFIRHLACFLSGKEIPDLNSGLRAFKRDVMLKFVDFIPDGFSCVTTMTLSFLTNGYTIKYVPIEYFRRVGKSKFHPVRDTYNYMLLVVRMIMYYNPLKIFVPVGMAILVAGLAKAVRDMIVYYFKVTGSAIVAISVGVQIIVVGLLADLIVKRVGKT